MEELQPKRVSVVGPERVIWPKTQRLILVVAELAEGRRQAVLGLRHVQIAREPARVSLDPREVERLRRSADGGHRGGDGAVAGGELHGREQQRGFQKFSS